MMCIEVREDKSSAENFVKIKNVLQIKQFNLLNA